MGYGKHVKKILYGGDYNPEQWPEEVWQEDMRMMKKAHINMVTLNVFSWAALQPDEDTYDFAKLDKIMELVRENGLQACMATSTGAHPAWMAKRHPDILRTENNGMKRKFGGRHNPARTVRLTANTRRGLQRSLCGVTRIMTISRHGMYPMNLAGNAIARTAGRHSGNG